MGILPTQVLPRTTRASDEDLPAAGDATHVRAPYGHTVLSTDLRDYILAAIQKKANLLATHIDTAVKTVGCLQDSPRCTQHHRPSGP